MLDTRYIHLHEALGLGVMWLRHGARLLHEPVVNRTQAAIASAMQEAPPVVMPTLRAQSARLAALQKVGVNAAAKNAPIEAEKPISELPKLKLSKVAETQSTNDFSGSLKPVSVMVLSVCASPEDVAAGKLFSGEDGKLLRKMLAAIGLGDDDVLLNAWLKDLPDFNPVPSAEIVAQAFERIQHEYQESGEPVLLLLGSFFERTDVLQYIEKLGKKVRYFMIAHPMRIAGNPALKRPAWETLQHMQQVLINHETF